MTLDVVTRIRRRLIPDGECMVFLGCRNRDGYGTVRYQGKVSKAHRVWWMVHGREIPDGLTIDHLCRNRACVRLDHLEVVSLGENIRRGDSPPARHRKQTHCVNGHAFDLLNTEFRPNGAGRKCRACALINAHRQRERNKMKGRE